MTKVSKATLVAAIAGLCLTATSASADWQYVKWGMTADQVVAASKGQLKASAGDGGHRIVCIVNDQKPMAFAPEKKVGGFVFDVIVCGTSGKVSSVALRGKSDNYVELRTALLSRYGQPIQDSRGDMGTAVWRDTKHGNLVRLSRVIDSGSIEYRSLGSSAQSGNGL